MATGNVLATAATNGGGKSCCKSGPGYASPLAAMSGPREKLIYVTALYSGTRFSFPIRLKHVYLTSLVSFNCGFLCI